MSKILKKYRLLFLFVLVAIVGAALFAGRGRKAEPAPIVVPDGAKAGDLTGMKNCAYQAEGSKTIYQAECATLTVPENWDVAASRLTALPVVRIPATGPNPEEPVFWLMGGPGNSNLSWNPPAWLLANHDVVLVGYRGVDGTVKLACREAARMVQAHLGKDLWSAQARQEYAAGVEDCVADVQKHGIDLSGYTVTGVVADLEAARLALGYDRVDLLGESYGTRVEQIYAYQHPDSLFRVVMIGVNTPGHFIYDPAVLDQMIRYLGKLCAKDADCSSRTSDFAQTMYDVNHNMPRQWLFFRIDPDSIRMGTHAMFSSKAGIALIADSYLAAGEGDPSGLALLNLVAPMMMPADKMMLGDFFNKGGTMDWDKYGGLESISLGKSIMGAPWSELIWPMAAEWPIKLIPQQLREFQETDVDMLLVNGTVDFATPPNALDEAKPYFHKAQMVLLPEFGHTGDEYTLQPAAFERLITSYYDTGVADSSLYVYEPLSFKPAMSVPVVAKLLVAAMIVVPLLIALIIVVIVRRIRRRRTVQA